MGPTPFEAYAESIFDSYAAIGSGIRSIGDFLAIPANAIADYTSSPTLAAFEGFVSGVIQLPFDIVGGLVDIRGLANGISAGFSPYYEAGGGGVYGTLSGLSALSGLFGGVESIYGTDVLTGRVLNGDERFDRAVLGAGALGGFVLGGVGVSASLFSRAAIAASNGSRFARVLNTNVRTFGIRKAPALSSGRIAAIRDALTDANGQLLTRAERQGVTFTIRRVEAQGFRLEGSIKIRANQGIDLSFRGTGKNTGRFALAEAKKPGSLGSLVRDTLGIRQGSRDFFLTRLRRAGRNDLRLQLQAGNVDLFGGFLGSDGSGRLFQFNPQVFRRDVNFRTTPGAATLIIE